MVFPQTYRAYQYDHYGPIEDELKLRSGLPQKALAANEIRVKVHSASVNPIDYKLVEFVGQMMLGGAPSPEQPFAIGHDAAGEVVEIGSDVKRFKVGDAVYASATEDSIGSLAEYWILNEEVAALKPKNLNFNEAAAVPSVAITAYAGVTEHAKLQRGDTLLVLGGSSSVGMFITQFARNIGARVIATTSSRNVELVKSLGADQVVDYTKEKWVDVLPPHSVDAVYDCGVEPSAWNDGAQVVLKKNTGRFITILPMAQPVKDSEFGAQLVGFISHNNKSSLNTVTKYIEDGKVKPVIDTVYPFEKALDAFEKLKTGHAQGKLVIEVHP